MKIRQTYYNHPEQGHRVRIVNRKDETMFNTYSAVTHVTEEIDEEASRYYVLHIDNGETATFPADEWELQVEIFARIW